MTAKGARMVEVRRTLALGAGTGLLLATMTTMAAADLRPAPSSEVAQAGDGLAQDVDVRRRATGIDGVITAESACIEDALHLSYGTDLDDAAVLVDGVPMPGPVGTLPWPTVEHEPSGGVEVRVVTGGATYRLLVPLTDAALEACTVLGPTQVAEAFEVDDVFDLEEDAEVKGVVITSENGRGDAESAQVVEAPGRAGTSAEQPADNGGTAESAPDDATAATEVRPSEQDAGEDAADRAGGRADRSSSADESENAGTNTGADTSEPDFASAVAAGAMSVTGSSASPLAIGAATALLLSGGVALATGVRPNVRRRP